MCATLAGDPRQLPLPLAKQSRFIRVCALRGRREGLSRPHEGLRPCAPIEGLGCQTATQLRCWCCWCCAPSVPWRCWALVITRPFIPPSHHFLSRPVESRITGARIQQAHSARTLLFNGSARRRDHRNNPPLRLFTATSSRMPTMAVLFIRGPAPPSRLMPDQHKLIVLHSVMTSFALVTVITRSYIRAVKLKAFKTDDTLMAIAAVCTTP